MGKLILALALEVVQAVKVDGSLALSPYMSTADSGENSPQSLMPQSVGESQWGAISKHL